MTYKNTKTKKIEIIKPKLEDVIQFAEIYRDLWYRLLKYYNKHGMFENPTTRVYRSKIKAAYENYYDAYVEWIGEQEFYFTYSAHAEFLGSLDNVEHFLDYAVCQGVFD